MAYKGILVDVDYCSGCQACVLACQQEHGYDENRYGIVIHRFGPVEIEKDKWQYDFYPQLTDWCDLCDERVESGKQPSCVQHCQAQCLRFGDVESLAASIDSRKQIVIAHKEA